MTWWSWTFLAAIVAVSVIIIVWGTAGFNENRARNVKYIELIQDRVTVDHIVEVARAHPEIVRTSRLDWHPYFLIPHVSVWCYAVAVFAGAELTNNVAVLGGSTRLTMATCFIVGSSLVLGSALLGGQYWPGKHIMPSVADHMTVAVLGHDIVLPYRLSMAGQFAVSVSMAIYSATSFTTTAGSLGGWLTGGLALACCVLSPWMYVHVRRFQRWDPVIIREASIALGLTAGETDGS